MAVVVLPANHTLPSVDDGRPVFIESKVLESGQLVLHWEVPDNEGHEAEFSWRIQPTQSTLEEMWQHSALLNEESAKRRQTATYNERTPTPSRAFPPWAAKAGAIFGGLTLVFFMAVVYATMTGGVIPPSGRFPVIAVLALGLAMATAFLGGDAVAKGHLPLPFLKDNPIQFSVAGGIAVFVIVLLIGNAVFGSSSTPGEPSPGTQQSAGGMVPTEESFRQFIVGRWSARQVVAPTGYQYDSILVFSKDGTYAENDLGNPPVAMAGSWRITPVSADSFKLTETSPAGVWTYTITRLDRNSFKNEVQGYTAHRVSD
jgi:hypothetical protein